MNIPAVTPHQRLDAALDAARLARAAACEADDAAADALCDLARDLVPLDWRPDAPYEVPPRCYVDLPHGRVYVTRMSRGWEAWGEPDCGPSDGLLSLVAASPRAALASLYFAASAARPGPAKRFAVEVAAALATLEIP